jgi:hypothetical protein
MNEELNQDQFHASQQILGKLISLKKFYNYIFLGFMKNLLIILDHEGE